MTLRPSQHHVSGTRTFYVASDSHAGTEYTVQHIRFVRGGPTVPSATVPIR